MGPAKASGTSNWTDRQGGLRTHDAHCRCGPPSTAGLLRSTDGWSTGCDVRALAEGRVERSSSHEAKWTWLRSIHDQVAVSTTDLQPTLMKKAVVAA